jgi:hypothetical protein
LSGHGGAGIAEWGGQVNLTITESDSAEAELRISFAQQGSWSYEGTDALGVPKVQPTINYGMIKGSSDAAATQMALHEFGHALGLHHEYQNPSAGDIFNRSALSDYYAATNQNQPRANTMPVSGDTMVPGPYI